MDVPDDGRDPGLTSLASFRTLRASTISAVKAVSDDVRPLSFDPLPDIVIGMPVAHGIILTGSYRLPGDCRLDRRNRLQPDARGFDDTRMVRGRYQ